MVWIIKPHHEVNYHLILIRGRLISLFYLDDVKNLVASRGNNLSFVTTNNRILGN